MAAPAIKRATYADIEALPPHVTGQIVDGVLYTSPRPADEPELHFGSDILVPDIAGWRNGRIESQLGNKFFTVAPDWLCEVLSPSTAGVDRVRKMPVYLREGVEHLWLVDPLARTLEAFRRQASGWTQVAIFLGDEKVRLEPFEAVELNLADLWVSVET